jgi:hypothetical protein
MPVGELRLDRDKRIVTMAPVLPPVRLARLTVAPERS